MNNPGAFVPVATSDLTCAKTSCPPPDEETPGPKAGTEPDTATGTETATDPNPATGTAPAAATDLQGTTGQTTQAEPENDLESSEHVPGSGFELASAFQDIATQNIFTRADLLTRWAGLAHVPDMSHILGPSIAAANLTAVMAARPVTAAALMPSISIDLGLSQTVTKMAASWHAGLLDHSRQLAVAIADLATAPAKMILDTARTASIFNTASIARSLSLAPPLQETVAQLGDLLRRWQEIADIGSGVMRIVARAALAAALRARTAVLHGEIEPIADFIVRWLGLRVTPKRIDAVSAALLEKGWDTSADDPGQLLSDLKRRTRRQARTLAPIWETQLNKRSVGLLDQPFITITGTLCTTADLVPDPHTTEDLALASMQDHQQRLRHVLARLKPDELDVTNLYAQHTQLTWAEAARAAGAPDPVATGERVRRKLRRLGEEHKRRLALQPTGA